jgi:hypothetical protein
MNGVTVYAVIGLPPLLEGAVQLTCAWPLATIALTPNGAEGALLAVGVTAFEGSDSAPLPLGFEAVTLNV